MNTAQTKTVLAYLFWKNVYHNWVLYNIVWIYFFCFNRYFRSSVRLNWACIRVEWQDSRRVFWMHLDGVMHQLSDTIIIANMLISELKDNTPTT